MQHFCRARRHPSTLQAGGLARAAGSGPAPTHLLICDAVTKSSRPHLGSSALDLSSLNRTTRPLQVKGPGPQAAARHPQTSRRTRRARVRRTAHTVRSLAARLGQAGRPESEPCPRVRGQGCKVVRAQLQPAVGGLGPGCPPPP